MNVFIYWNRIDRDSKHIYKFLDDGSFINKLQEVCNVKLHKPNVKFALNDTIKSEIEESDIVIFFTHGMEDAILISKYKHETEKRRFSLIDTQSASMLANKKVIAICCDSAKCLGPHCVNQVGSIFYIGFQDALRYDDGTHLNARGLIYQSYREAFDCSFSYSLETKCSASVFVNILRKNIHDMLTSHILNDTANHSLGPISNIHFHHQSAESLIALGNSDISLFG